ncbi:hypothetical protein NIES267_10830 [Calothrix parasitica NIES-267]|uniref:Uncharacterized protein n=1 Tax=Calothrix parasitica NIES-267 TaxID=1973488 RepID=A0A1Z4LK50_9CYAN|nr:hypothetical protein NIES267_10830 [Calothrix parasitica NIES-267]
MLNNFRKTFVLVAVIATLSTGCRNSKQYENLAVAGDSYTDAVDTLLEKAKELHIEASSEAILAADRGFNRTAEQYQKNAAQDEEIITTINEIKNHNRLLKEYFDKLKQLATTNAPERTKDEINGIAENLEKVSKNLEKTDFFPEKRVFLGIGDLVINSKIQGALREELEKRDKLILRELIIQQEMLKKLSGFMKIRVDIKNNAKELHFVIRPLIREEKMTYEEERNWIKERLDILQSDNRIQQLENASKVLKNFKNVFKDSVEGKITVARLNNALEDIDDFLALLEKPEKPEATQENTANTEEK